MISSPVPAYPWLAISHDSRASSRISLTRSNKNHRTPWIILNQTIINIRPSSHRRVDRRKHDWQQREIIFNETRPRFKGWRLCHQFRAIFSSLFWLPCISSQITLANSFHLNAALSTSINATVTRSLRSFLVLFSRRALMLQPFRTRMALAPIDFVQC